MTHRIRVTCELNIAGHHIPAEYYDLPDEWDQMSKKERDEYLRELAVEELTAHASSGACVVDENDEVVE